MIDWTDLRPTVESAVRELGCPSTVWYRGHTKDHKLVPSLFRFENATQQEGFLLEQYRRYLALSNANVSTSDWEATIRMHHSYVPTRLLAWTESLAVALFCALVREGGEPCIFVLDPRRLNRVSGYSDIIRLDEPRGFDYRSLYLEKHPSAPALPVAVEAPFDTGELPLRQTAFTIHGTIDAPLETQCAESVRKAVLDREMAEQAQGLVLSMRWLLSSRR